MVATNLDISLKFLLVSEGGYSNDAHDPGGPTDFGVTQAEYNSYRRLSGSPTQSVKLISMAEVTAIYRGNYWDVVKSDMLPSGLDYCVFDDAVNAGPHEAILELQRAVNDLHDKSLAVDGLLGVITLDFIKDCDTAELIQAYVKRRMGFYRCLRTFQWFGSGWTHRIYGQEGDPGVLKNALSLVNLPAIALAA